MQAIAIPIAPTTKAAIEIDMSINPSGDKFLMRGFYVIEGSQSLRNKFQEG